MATFLQNQDDDTQNNQFSTTNQNMGASFSGAVQPSAMSPQENRPQGSGRFTNIQQYLGANQGAGSELAQGIGARGQEQAQSIREGIEQAQGVRRGVQDEQMRLAQAGQLAQGIQDDAVSVAQNNLQDVTRLRLGQTDANRLQGQGMQAMQGLQQSVDPLQQLSQNLGTESGRFQVLQDTFGGAFRPDYNLGQRRLDQLFLQGDPNAGIGQMQSEFGAVAQQGQRGLQDLGQTMQQGVAGLGAQAQDARQQILGAIGGFGPNGSGAFGQTYMDLDQGRSAEDIRRLQQLREIQDRFGQGNILSTDAELLGLTGPVQVADMNLAQFGQQNIGTQDATMRDALNDDLQMRLNALSQLSGTNLDDYLSQLGSQTDQVTFDADRFGREAGRAVDSFDPRFFDRTYFNENDITNPDLTDQQRQALLDRTISQQIEQLYTGAHSLPLGHSFFTPFPTLHGFNEVQNRDRNALNQVIQDATARGQSSMVQAHSARNAQDKFQNLLNMFDQEKNRQLNISPVQVQPGELDMRNF
jgi:hypothetical protein